MKGAIIGDIIGSAFINKKLSNTNFQLFGPSSEYTDDTVLTMATAESVIFNIDYKETLINWVLKYPNAGYRDSFLNWIKSGALTPYISKGPGAARRVSPIGFAASSIKEALEESQKSTIVTHNVPVRIEASQATAVSIFMAKNGATKKEIRSFVSVHFDYDLSLSTTYWKKKIQSGEKLITPVPPAMAAFLEASDFEEAIRLAIFTGGPTNTIASIAGGLAHAYFKHIPKAFTKRALSRITPEMEELLNDFEKKYS